MILEGLGLSFYVFFFLWGAAIALLLPRWVSWLPHEKQQKIYYKHSAIFEFVFLN